MSSGFDNSGLSHEDTLRAISALQTANSRLVAGITHARFMRGEAERQAEEAIYALIDAKPGMPAPAIADWMRERGLKILATEAQNEALQAKGDILRAEIEELRGVVKSLQAAPTDKPRVTKLVGSAVAVWADDPQGDWEKEWANDFATIRPYSFDERGKRVEVPSLILSAVNTHTIESGRKWARAILEACDIAEKMQRGEYSAV